ncbi:MAG: AraC family transcriptional regulator, partial [Bacteroidales bacterium]|nr:AraC family transcriptional regulator [Bacteroidales bacterium]
VWMFICYFIYKHESVVEELKAIPQVQDNESEESDIALKIMALFENDKVYLNPNLRLSDIASLVGTNRTYVSRFFNNECKVSFFDFVNGYRVNLAKSILKESSDKIDSIAEKTGFNSRQSFYRVFTKIVGMPPEKYRAL